MAIKEATFDASKSHSTMRFVRALPSEVSSYWVMNPSFTNRSCSAPTAT
jgi:hypothetical protein